MGNWCFLTNHARALLVIAHDPDARLRDLAAALDVTERTAYGIVVDLTEAGYVAKEKDGRRNRYHIQAIFRCATRSAGNGPSARFWTSSSTPTSAEAVDHTVTDHRPWRLPDTRRGKAAKPVLKCRLEDGFELRRYRTTRTSFQREPIGSVASRSGWSAYMVSTALPTPGDTFDARG
jgi:DNA-binding MarR family transcriptional regulator